MAAMSNLEVIRDQYAATNEHDWQRAMSHYAEDVVLEIRGRGVIAGTYEGREAVGEWFGDWFRTFTSKFDIKELEEQEGGRVLLAADVTVHGKGSGIDLVGEVVWVYALEGGKIVRVDGSAELNQRDELGLDE